MPAKIGATSGFETNDIVTLFGSNQPKNTMIIVELKSDRPINPYLGVLINGKGAPYKFGPRQRPEKTGVADLRHPALVAYHNRMERMGGHQGNADVTYRKLVQQLISAVKNSDLDTARVLAEAIEALG